MAWGCRCDAMRYADGGIVRLAANRTVCIQKQRSKSKMSSHNSYIQDGPTIISWLTT